MHLVKYRPALVGLKIADALLWCGRRLAARYAVVPDGQPADAHYIWSEQWRMGMLQFCFFGDLLQFSQRKMLAADFCTRDAWEAYTGVLVSAGVLVKVPRAGCFWAHTWNRHRLGAELRHGLSLPYPADRPAPALFSTRRAATQTAQRSAAAAQVSLAWSRTVPPAGRLKRR